jgi:hypothetical protein
LLKRKLFRKPTTATIILKKKKSATSDDYFEKNKSAHGNKNEHIEEVMKQKGIELRSLIIKPLSDEESYKIKQIKQNTEAKPEEIYRHYGTKKVSWGSMRRLLKSDTKDQSKRWIKDEVIKFYFKKYLAEMDRKQCQE